MIFSDKSENNALNKAYSQVIELLNEWGTAFQEEPEGSSIQRIIYEEKLPDLIDRVACIITFEESYMQVTTLCHTEISSDKTAEILSFMNKLNSCIDFGSFMLLNDKITFRTHLSYDDESEFSFQILADTIQKGTDSFYDYGDGFARIMSGEANAEQETIRSACFNLLSHIPEHVPEDEDDEAEIHNLLQHSWLPTLFYNSKYIKDLLMVLEKNGEVFLSTAVTSVCGNEDDACYPDDYSVEFINPDADLTHIKITLPDYQVDGLSNELHLICTKDLVSRQFFMVEDGNITSLLPEPDGYIEYENNGNKELSERIEELFIEENGIK